MNRRDMLYALGAGLLAGALPRLAIARTDARRTLIGAAWRGPRESDPHFAGALAADWEARTLSIHWSVPLPSRPHGLLVEEDGGLLVCSFRPGEWLLRCDAEGRVMRRLDMAAESPLRNSGHAVLSASGEAYLVTEVDPRSGGGRIAVRDRRTLAKLADWDSHGIEPHQLLLDGDGKLIIANGGITRDAGGKAIDKHRMASSLVRLDGKSGALLGRWTLDDPRTTPPPSGPPRRSSPSSTASGSPPRRAPRRATATAATSPRPTTAASRSPATASTARSSGCRRHRRRSPPS
jgi:hypothetical protein